MSTLKETNFSDIYITPGYGAYISDGKTPNGLAKFESDDFPKFFQALEKAFDGNTPSYSVVFDKIFYRVERSITISGVQYCARKMPPKVPPFSSLGYSPKLTAHLLGLSSAAGLILCAGPTGAGKTTTVSCLLKEFLIRDGGFAYTIEDPSELPLAGTYPSMAGGLGLCEQTQPPGGKWGEGLKSALRSNPRYILVGEIRTPETASEVLRAATSGHLVLSTIHANNVTDAISSVIKYASSAGMSEDLAYDLFSRGMLAALHQTLGGNNVRRFPHVQHLFCNPDTTKGDQVRGIIKGGKLNLATSIETQMIRLENGQELFGSV